MSDILDDNKIEQLEPKSEPKALAAEVFARLEPRDQNLLQTLQSCHHCLDKTQKLQLLVQLLELDKTQTILKLLALQADSQTAFNFLLWAINGNLVDLDWIYDVAYKISTDQVRQDIKIQHIYKNSYRLTSTDLTMVIAHTQPLLENLHLKAFDPREVINSLQQGFLISLITSFLSFSKIGIVDLNNLAEIARSFTVDPGVTPAAKTDTSAGEATISVATKLSAEVIRPSRTGIEVESASFGLMEDNLEDILLAFNLKFGGSDEGILRRTLDNFLFMKVTDKATGADQIIYKPTTRASQYRQVGNEQQLVPMPVSSSQTWPAGVYLLQRGAASVKVMRLPGNDFFEIFPEGPDPYLRVQTINSTVSEATGKGEDLGQQPSSLT